MGLDVLGARRPLVRWACALVPFAFAGVLSLFKESMAPSTAAIVLVLLVVAAAATGDRFSGTVAALSAAAGFDFFLTAPFRSFSISDRDDVELAIALVVVGLVVSELALWGQRQQASALRRAGYIEGLVHLLDVERDASGRVPTKALTTAVTTVLGADRSEYVEGQPPLNDAIVDRDGRVLLGGRELDVERDGLPTDSWTAIPVRRGGVVVGHVRVSAASRVVRPLPDSLRTAVLLANEWASDSGPASNPGPTDASQV